MTHPKPLDLDAIEARARAATPGPWIPGHHANPDHPCNCRGVLCEWYMGAICSVHESQTRDIEEGDNPPPEEAASNARHIAGMDPSTTLALTSEVRKLRDEIETWQSVFPDIAPDQVLPDRSLLEAEVRKLREALAWYGEQARLCRLIHSEGNAGRNALNDDGGKRARAALGDPS